MYHLNTDEFPTFILYYLYLCVMHETQVDIIHFFVNYRFCTFFQIHFNFKIFFLRI